MKLLINEDLHFRKSFEGNPVEEGDLDGFLQAMAPLPAIFEKYAILGNFTLRPDFVELKVSSQKVTLTEEDMATVLYALGLVIGFKLRYSSVSSDSSLVFELVDVTPSWLFSA